MRGFFDTIILKLSDKYDKLYTSCTTNGNGWRTFGGSGANCGKGLDAMEKRTRVLLADANEEFRILLRQLLEETGEFEVAASTGDGPMVMELVRRTKPELILMDVVLPGLELRHPAPAGRGAGRKEGDRHIRILQPAGREPGGGTGRVFLLAQARQRGVSAGADAAGGTSGTRGALPRPGFRGDGNGHHS